MKDTFKDLFFKKNSYYEPEDEILNEKASIETISSKFPTSINPLDFALNKFNTRRSIRKFSSQEIEWKTIHSILEASFNAPCAGNIQNSKVLIIEDNEKRHELGKMVFQQFWISEAPLILVVLRDDFDLIEMYPQEGKVYSIQNTAALIENILLLSHFHGLGSCWVEAYDNEIVKEYLGVPQHLKIDALIPIGYPQEAPKVSKPELLSQIYFESFGNKKRK